MLLKLSQIQTFTQKSDFFQTTFDIKVWIRTRLEGLLTVTDHLKLLSSLVRPSGKCSLTGIIQKALSYYWPGWEPPPPPPPHPPWGGKILLAKKDLQVMIQILYDTSRRTVARRPYKRTYKLEIVPVEIRISLRFDKKYFARSHFRFVIFSLV